MKTDTFTYHISALCPREKALSLLSEFSQHSRLHPLIEKVEQAAPPPGVLRRYWITDRLQWGSFSFRVRYRADILSISPEEILTEAYQQPGTSVHNRTLLREANGRTEIEVEIRLSAPNLLFGYAFSQARAAHLEMAQRIQQALETEA